MLRMPVGVQDRSLASDSDRKSAMGATRRAGETWAERYLAGLGPVILVAALFLAVGCSGFGKRLEPGTVQEEWSSNLHQLGLVPVFPPREDLFVGDVYSYDYDPESPSTIELFRRPWSTLSEEEQETRLAIGMSPRLGRMDLSHHLVKEYESTISAAPTTAAYNDLLENPALAAATATVDEAQTSLDALERQVQVLEQELSEAEKALLEAEHAKEDADAEVKSAQTALDEGIEASTTRALENLRDKEDALRKAEQAQENVEDQAAKEAAERIVREARHERDDAKVALDRAREDKKAGTLHNSQAQNRLTSARSAQSGVGDELSSKERQRDRLAGRLERLRKALAEDIKAARDELEAAKALRNAIAAVGARHLYSQPRYEGTNVFTGEPTDGGVGRLNRFRLVAFPEFSAKSGNTKGLSGLVPIDALGIGLNLSSERVSHVVVRIPAAESYGLSLARVLPHLVTSEDEWCARPSEDFLKFVGRAAVRLSSTEKESVYLRVVTEVFYARAIDISIGSAKSFGVGGRARVAGSEKPGVDGEADGKPSASQTATELYSRVQADLDRTQTLPGASVEVIGYSDRSIGLRTVYERPIAIGFRGLVLKLAKTSGCFTEISFARSSAPTQN